MHCNLGSLARVAVALTAALFPLSSFAETNSAGPAVVGTISGDPGPAVTIEQSPADVRVIDLQIPRYTRRRLYALVEYRPSDCTQVSSGAWTLTTAASFGRITTGTISGHLGNGACPGTTFTFGAIFYEWTAHRNLTTLVNQVRDTFRATWRSPGFTVPEEFHPRVNFVRPASETTAAAGWDGAGTGLWTQTLHPPDTDAAFNFIGETVEERAAAPAGPDTCWFAGSAFLPFTAITGGQWNVTGGNHWEFDHVGWFNGAINYYRAHGRAPCRTRFGQQMRIRSRADTAFHNYGLVNILGGQIGAASVTSTRAGRVQVR